MTFELLSCHDILEPNNPFVLDQDEDDHTAEVVYHMLNRPDVDEDAIGVFDEQDTITWHSSTVEHWLKKSKSFECK